MGCGNKQGEKEGGAGGKRKKSAARVENHRQEQAMSTASKVAETARASVHMRLPARRAAPSSGHPAATVAKRFRG